MVDSKRMLCHAVVVVDSMERTYLRCFTHSTHTHTHTHTHGDDYDCRQEHLSCGPLPSKKNRNSRLLGHVEIVRSTVLSKKSDKYGFISGFGH